MRPHVIVTIATDSATLYEQRAQSFRSWATSYPAVSTKSTPARSSGITCRASPTDHLIELTHIDRRRIFNLGYYTWVEQQGISLEDFEARRRPEFWSGIHELAGDWDALIDELNARTGVLESL